MTGPMTRVRLDVAYDGTDFHGWAVQPGLRTVAGELLAGLTRLTGSSGVTGLTVAGRTDAGVHATGQVCHLDTPTEVWQTWQDQLVPRLAGVLPPDVRVTAARSVPADFDARFSALSRRYVYRVTDAPHGADPLQRRYTLAWRRPLDSTALAAAATGLVGEHDFAAYCRRSPTGTTIRRIIRLEWHRQVDGTLVATVEADAFCQAMVRSLVGAMLAVGDGRRPVGWPAELLSRRERATEVQVAPAHGLTLVAVAYPDADQWAARAALTRRRRTTASGC